MSDGHDGPTWSTTVCDHQLISKTAANAWVFHYIVCIALHLSAELAVLGSSVFDHARNGASDVCTSPDYGYGQSKRCSNGCGYDPEFCHFDPFM